MAARTYQDSVGAVWEVFEVHRSSERAGAVSTGMEKGWLAFVSGAEKRRLAPFPAGWLDAVPAELERLCASARIATHARSLSVRESLHGAHLSEADSTVFRPPERTPREGGGRGRGKGTPESGRAAALPVDGTLAVEDAVRAFAHQARATSVPAIEAMVRLKGMLLTAYPDPNGAARDMRRVRRWFVEAYYFERNA